MKTPAFIFSLLLASLLLLAFGGRTASPPPESPPGAGKISPYLQAELAAGGTAEFLVVLAEQADLRPAYRLPTKAEKGRYVYRTLWETAQRTQAPLKAWLATRGVPFRSFYIVNALLVTGDRQLAQTLAARADVARLSANPALRMPRPLPAPPERLARATGIEPNLTYVHADAVWAMGFTGQGIVIGGQDTGYDWDHPALINHYRGWDGATASHDYNWHDSIHVNEHGTNPCGVDSPQPCDDDSHGTHTMGTATGDDGGSNRIGMAPGAKWIGCRNMDNGWGKPSTYLECFEFFLAPYPVGGTPAQGKPDLAPDVTTNSWTCPVEEGCDAATLRAAVEAQRAAGIMTVVAAGNGGSACSTVWDPPSFYDAAYTVGALRTGTDTLASFSSRGPVVRDGSNRRKPDIAAPGTSIRSSVPGGGYSSSFSGTSMATPHVAGAVALLWSAVPTLTGNITATETYFNDNAVHISSTSCSSSGWPNNLYGYGRLDVLAAVQAAQLDYNLASPSAAFTHTLPVLLNQPVAFTNTTTGTPPITYTWRFGDGSPPLGTGTARLPVQHTYT
ncbi:MAG: PKD domain-containing protein, partial [Caldilineae bacterium]